ncbi:MAG: hypothetical protein EBV39_03660 [Actinobacteria bacterium]|nr:hypothetical protein [Actinomycetota bacterium]
MRTIDFLEQGDGAITLIDQRLLPHKKEILTIKTHQELIEAIQTLAVRGAPALGVAGALGVALIALRSEQEKWNHEERDSAIAALRAARPTAVNLAWGVDQVLPELVNGPSSVLKSALAISRADGLANRAMGKLGAAYLLEKCGKKKLRILTHCNTGSLATSDWGTALGVIRELSAQGYIEEVFADETRPLLQGSRLTAWELSEAGIKYRILPDGALLFMEGETPLPKVRSLITWVVNVRSCGSRDLGLIWPMARRLTIPRSILMNYQLLNQKVI